MKQATETETLELVEEKVVTQKKLSVILHNDEVNTFDFVINSLIDVCNHDPLQAEQCTFIVHYNGKCDVKKGTFSELRPIRTELSNRGLTATIE